MPYKFKFLLLQMFLQCLLLGSAWSAVTCSSYKGQVSINEIRIGTSGSSNITNQVELYNPNGIAQSVWQTWSILINYRKSTSTTATKYGPYALSSGFISVNNFIYNNNKAMYLRNRNTRFVDIALLDASGNFIDYVALEGTVQTVPTCMTKLVINTTPTADTTGYAARSTDGGSWPANVAGTYSTMGSTNVCTAGTSPDLSISNAFDIAAPTVDLTTVTYSVIVSNKSCTAPASGVATSLSNITATNFSSLSTSVTTGSVSQQSTGLNWTIGTMAAGSIATATVTGIPHVLGPFSSVASITAPATGRVNTADDTDSASINVHDFNYVSFDVATDAVTEGTDASYSVKISSDATPSAKITISYTVSGTGTSSDTNLPASGTVVIDPASVDSPSQTSIDFTITNDNIRENQKFIVFTITGVSSTDPTVRRDTTASVMTLTLNDDDTGILLNYNMDEAIWTGATGEVIDQSVNGFHGTAKNNASITLGKLCSAGNFTGSNYVQGPTTDIGLSTAITVMAWVKWGVTPSTALAWASIVNNNGPTSDVGQFWLQHTSTNANFEFALKTNVSRYNMASTSATAVGVWRHVAGTWDAATAQMKIYVDGVLEKTMAAAGTSITPFVSGFSLNVGRWSMGSGRYFNGSIDEVKLLNYALNATELQAIYSNESAGKNWDGGSRICVTPINLAPGWLNAFDSSTANGAITGFIKTKVAGTPFSLDVVALNTAKTAVDSSFAQSVKVELLANAGTGTTVDASNCPSSSSVLQSTTLSLASGRSSIALPAEANVWRDARLRLSYPATGTATVVACSNDNFAIRPASLAAVASDADWQTAGNGRTLSTISAAGAPFHKAGQPFTLTVTAYNASSVVASNYAGTPAPGTPTCVLPSSGCVGGLLSTGTFTGTGGTVSSSTASYSEVGAISLTMQDSSFSSVDAADGSSAAELTAYATAISVGRFVPDHFSIIAGTATPGCSAVGKTAFTYLGQDGLATQQSITAQNAQNGVTSNYTGSLARLNLSNYASYGFAASGLPTGSVLSTGATAPAGSWTAGAALSTSAYHLISKPATAAAQASIGITSTPVDSDGVTVSSASQVASGQVFRHGRLKLSNVYGATTADIVLPLQAQYWNVSRYVLNPDDSCTSLGASAIGFRNYNSDLSSTELATSHLVGSNWPLSGGTNALRVTKPTSGDGKYRGSTDVFINLGTELISPANCPNGSTTTAPGLGYLQDAWPWNSATCANPVGRITLGSEKQKWVFRREVY